MRINHKQKLKLARKMLTPAERKRKYGATGVFLSKAWNVRIVAKQLKVVRIEAKQKINAERRKKQRVKEKK